MTSTLPANLEAALDLHARGFWPVTIHAKGATIRMKDGDKIATGKEPIGKAWGAERWTEERLRQVFRDNPGAGVGVCLGPYRGPECRWLIDPEGDGPQAAESLARLLGGEVATLGWGATRGSHNLFVVDTPDGERLLALLVEAKAEALKGEGKTGVWKLAELPDLEFRIGGFKPDQTVKQCQSVVPPTIGSDGKPREWSAGAVEVAELPEAAFTFLEGIAERKRSEAKANHATNNGHAPSHWVRTATRGASVEDRVIAYLGTIEPAISGQNGSGKTFGAVCRVGPGFDLHPDVALRLIATHYNPRCVPPWSEAELRHKIEDAYKNETRRGWKLDESGFGDAPRQSTMQRQANPSATSEAPTFDGVVLKPISPALAPVPELDPCMIPHVFRAWLQDIADRACLPLAYAAAALIVALSGLIGRRLGIRPKRYDDWLVVCNLWGAIVGPPGFLKTPAVEAVMRPLKRLVAEAMKAHEDAIKAHNEQLMVATARRGAAKKNLDAAAKNKDSTEAELQELAKAAMADAAEEEPKCKRYLVNDFTVEKLGEMLVENPNGLTVLRDELTGLLSTLKREGHESDRGFLLECWNGTGSFTFDRIARGTRHIPAACLALFGSVQPGPLARYMQGTINGNEADGFIPRFQVLVYPDPPEKYVHVDRWPNKDAKNDAYAVFRAIDQLNAVDKGCKSDDEGGLPFLNFTPEAQQFFDGWYTELQGRLRSGELTDVMASHLAKYGSFMASLALIFHLVENCQARKIEGVSLDAAQMAAAWCDYLEAHARRVYLLCADGDVSAAVTLAERIKGSLTNPFTFRELAQKGWSGISTVDDARKAVGILEDRGWLRTVEVAPDQPTKGGRPSEKVWINPKVFSTEGGVSA